ncbi:MAG: glycosyltransferase family 39 protein, partial [Gammaproteobacteria bacterium]
PCTAVGLLAVGMFVALQIITSGAQVLSPVYSGQSLAEQMGDRDTSGIPFYTVEDYQQSLPFYLRRTLTLVAYQGEMNFGIQREPEKWIPDLETFTQQWQQDARAFAVMQTDTYQSLSKQGLPMQVIARDPARVIVEKP